MSGTAAQNAIAVVGIDIGKNSFHGRTIRWVVRDRCGPATDPAMPAMP